VRRFRVHTAIAAAVFALLATGTAYACNEPRATPTGPKPGPDANVTGSAHPGDPVEVDLLYTSKGAPYSVTVAGRTVLEGVD
jgi:hypothetical protein